MKNQSTTLLEAQKAQNKFHPALTVLITVGIYFIASILVSVPMLIISFIQGGETFVGNAMSGIVSVSWWGNSLLIIVTLTFVAYCKWIEKRSPRSMGFTPMNIDMVAPYIEGATYGILMICAAMLICVLTGSIDDTGIARTAPVGVIILWLFGFMIQGMSEEVMCRGYLMVSLSNRMPVAWAIFLSSLFFSLMHGLNPGISWIAILNLLLYGIFAALYFLHTDNIWAVSANHAFWNWAQGNLFGIEVSGQSTNATIYTFASTGKADIISGGEFGLEGGLAVTAVLVGVIVGLLYNRKKK